MSISIRHQPVLLNRAASLSAALRGMVAPTKVLRNGFGRSVEYLLEPDTGRGRVEYVDAGPEMWIIALDCVFHRDLRFEVIDSGLMRFNFSLKLDVALQLQGLGEIAAKEPSSWRVIHNPPRATTIESYPKNVPARWVTIACHPHLIARLTGIDESKLPPLLQPGAAELTDDGVAIYQPYTFCARMRAATADVLNARIVGPARISYIRARCTELLCLAAMHITQSADELPARGRLTERDRDILSRIKAQVDADYLHCPSSSELSRQHGLNRNKLFYGFKALYGVSVTEYVRDLRIVEGRRLLIETDMPVAVISEKLGFTHAANFSTAIKRLYGVTPMGLRARR